MSWSSTLDWIVFFVIPWFSYCLVLSFFVVIPQFSSHRPTSVAFSKDARHVLTLDPRHWEAGLWAVPASPSDNTRVAGAPPFATLVGRWGALDNEGEADRAEIRANPAKKPTGAVLTPGYEDGGGLPSLWRVNRNAFEKTDEDELRILSLLPGPGDVPCPEPRAVGFNETLVQLWNAQTGECPDGKVSSTPP